MLTARLRNLAEPFQNGYRWKSLYNSGGDVDQIKQIYAIIASKGITYDLAARVGELVADAKHYITRNPQERLYTKT